MIQNLLNYQSVDAKLKDIEKKLAGSEEKKKALTAKKYLEGVEENVNKLDSRAEELKSAFEKAVADQNKLKEQQLEISEALKVSEDEKEVQFLIKKADELIKNIKAIEGLSNKLLEEIQSIIKNYSGIKKNTQVAQAQYKENAEKYNELKDSIKGEKDKVESELQALKEKVDPALMERYLKKRADKMYPVLFEVKGDNCGACGMELSMAEKTKLKNGEVIDCDNCGRMNYLADK